MSQLNSVTQNFGARAEVIVPARSAAVSKARISGRSPIDTSLAPCACQFGPAVRVRVVRPHVETGVLRARLPVRRLQRDAQEGAHELHRRHHLDVLGVVPERPETPGNDEIARADTVYRVCEGVDHSSVLGRRNRPSLDTLRRKLTSCVWLVPNLPEAHPRERGGGARRYERAAVAARRRLREIGEPGGRRPGSWQTYRCAVRPGS